MSLKKHGLFALFLPIFLELLFTILAGMVDTMMLASVGDHAVGAVGTANSYINVFLVLFTIISSGMMAVMTQYIGAKRPGIAQQTLRLGLLVNLAAGVIISLLLCVGADLILTLVGIAQDLREPARIYMQTVGCFCICSALIPVYSSYLRAFGHTASTMYATIFSNVINFVLNALFLFVLNMGVFGVALATGISRLINLIWVWAASRFRVHKVSDPSRLKNGEIYRKIMRIGLPGAMEIVLYNLAMMIITSLLNRMDSNGLQVTARAYASQIANFSYCASSALAQANAILVGWRIGAGEIQLCDRETRRNAVVGILMSGCGAGILALFAEPILGIFTQDPEMIRLVGILLAIEIALEMGRAANMVFGFSLKSSGDAAYPMMIAVVFMFLLAVGGTWLFGVKLGWLVIGSFVGMALDECTRAVLMFLRWHKGYWKNKSLLNE
ncbi:MAG: MATE family efflux transporter [Oscillospiraceae bacterium]|nr:MATE family efflux transporter [Oscillospiraceae bacterium]